MTRHKIDHCVHIADLLYQAGAVYRHNRFGRLYIVVIAPFHRLVVRSALARAAARGWR